MVELCGICGLEFGGPADLLEHMKERHGVVPAATPAAPVAAVPSAARGTHRTEPFVCGICGQPFATRERLARHNLFVDHLSILQGLQPRVDPSGYPSSV